jgi:hypothetical protein
MQGTWNHGLAHYRCTFAADYAVTSAVQHPKTNYVREDVITPRLDAWIAQLFEPDQLDSTCQLLAEAQEHDGPAVARVQAARKTISDCDRRLENYRKQLDQTGPTATIGGWIAEVEAEREAAERVLGASIPKPPLTAAQIKAIILSLKDNVRILAETDPETTATLYREMGLTMTYDPERKVVTVEMDISGSPPSSTGDSRVRKSVSERGLQP